MTTEHLLRTPDGRTLFVVDAGGPADAPPLVWHNGSPHTGRLLAPVVAYAAAAGFRVVTYARPSYGASTPLPGRDVASAARDVDAIAEALGMDRFVVAGASGGGPHALACAALLPGRVLAAATFASPAPYPGSDTWFDGMAAPGALRSALDGRGAALASRRPTRSIRRSSPHATGPRSRGSGVRWGRMPVLRMPPARMA